MTTKRAIISLIYMMKKILLLLCAILAFGEYPEFKARMKQYKADEKQRKKEEKRKAKAEQKRLKEH